MRGFSLGGGSFLMYAVILVMFILVVVSLLALSTDAKFPQTDFFGILGQVFHVFEMKCFISC